MVKTLLRIDFAIYRIYHYLKIVRFKLSEEKPFQSTIPIGKKIKALAPLLLAFSLCFASPAKSEPQNGDILHVFLVGGEEKILTRKDLEGMVQIGFRSSSPWMDGIRHFEGVPLRSLIRTLHPDAQRVQLKAKDDYHVTFELDALAETWPILALTIDGMHISPRTKGPYWVVYPYDDHPELRRENIYARSIWQVEQLKIE